MIARIWHGKTSLENYQTYTDFLKRKAIPDYEGTPGFQKLIFLRNIIAQEGHFTLITFLGEYDLDWKFCWRGHRKKRNTILKTRALFIIV